MSIIETTSKVSLKLTSRKNLGRRGAHVPSSQLWTQPTSTHTARKAPIPNPPEKAGPHSPGWKHPQERPKPPPQEYPRHHPPPNRTRAPTTPPHRCPPHTPDQPQKRECRAAGTTRAFTRNINSLLKPCFFTITLEYQKQPSVDTYQNRSS